MFKIKLLSIVSALLMSCSGFAANGETTLSKVYDFTSTKLDGGVSQIALSLCTDGVTPYKDDKNQWAFKGDGLVASLAFYCQGETLGAGTYTACDVDFDEKTLKPKDYKAGTFAKGREYKLFGLFPIPIFSYCAQVKNGKVQPATYFTDGSVTVAKANNNHDVLLKTSKGNYHYKGAIDPKQMALTSIHYYDKTKKEGALEKKYAALGSEETRFVEYAVADTAIKKIEIWHPKSMEKASNRYPVVIYANGTGNAASMQPDFFRHLASWGFIVVGNEDPNTRTGASCQKSLEKILALNGDAKSVFYNKVDTKHIGLAGHSQGGVAVYNAATMQPGAKYYKAIYAASATSPYWGQEGVFGHEWSYDLTKVKAPTFMIAGTGYFDSGTAKDITPHEGQGITPLWSLEMNYQALPATVKKIYARKKGIDHGETLNELDAYMTAWFRWLLCGDEEAAKAFVGSNGEIKHNSLYQDVKSNF